MNETPEHQTPEERLAAARSWAGNVEPAASQPARGTASHEMSSRIQTVIEAAERAADAIRYDAEEQADRHLAEAQQKADRLTAERVRLISNLTDDLIGHASVVREQSEKMVSSLEEAIRTVTERLEDESAGATLTTAAGPPPIESWEPAPATHEAPDADAPAEPSATDEPQRAGAGGGAPPAAALLRATQMAVAGHDRGAIGAAIRDEFGIDPEPVLARVLD